MLENKYCLLAVFNVDGNKRVPSWVWVQPVIVADLAHQFWFSRSRPLILYHGVASAKMFVRQECLHRVQEAHDIVLALEYSIFYQLPFFIGPNNVTDEATDSIQRNMQPLLCCQVVLRPKNAMPVTEVALCIWVLQFCPAKVHVDITQWLFGAADHVGEPHVGNFHPDPQHERTDALKNLFLQGGFVFSRVTHASKFVQQFIAGYVFVQNAKTKMGEHGQCVGVKISAWMFGASRSQLAYNRPAVDLFSVKYGKLLFFEAPPPPSCRPYLIYPGFTDLTRVAGLAA